MLILALCLVFGLHETAAAGFSAYINFQPAGLATPPRYLADSGAAFGLRTNDYWYGWSTDNKANAFARNLNADPRLDTGVKMQSQGQSWTWQILVPNGTYDVVLAAGDPAVTNGGAGTRYHITVENTSVISNAVPTPAQSLFGQTRHFQIAVNDGSLTIASGARGTNNSLCFVDIKQVAPIYWGAAIIDNANAHKCPNDYVSEASRGVLGYFESHTGKKISLVHWGNGSSSSLSGQTNFMAKMWARGTIPLYSWGPTSDKLTDLIAGSQDKYFTNWFKTAKAYGRPFFLNFAREMNGTWYTWSEGHATNNGCPPGSFTNMWRHVHNICKGVGCTNVTWVWVVDRDINNSKHLQPISRFYPGDAYVDWVAMDIYNAGQVAPYQGENFVALYGPTYSNVLQIAPNKPMMVCETATEDLADTPKPSWIAEALSLMPSAFPNLRAYLWFNWNDANTNKNYPIEGGNNNLPYTTAPVDWASVGAFSNGVASPYYLPNLFTNQAKLASPPIQPVLILDPPTQVRAFGSNGLVSVTWTSVPGATNYAVYRATAEEPLHWRTGTTNLQFIDTAVTNGITYRYVVRAQNLAGESLGSVSQLAVPTTKPNPISLVIASKNPWLELSWPASPFGWILQARTNSLQAGSTGSWLNVPGSATTNRVFLFPDPENGATYFRLIWQSP